MKSRFVPPTESSRLMRLATYASVATALLLITIKFWAWSLSGSASMLSSLMDSLMDLTVSCINLLAVRYALMPADSDHHFGHNSAEDVAALGQGAFIAGSAVFITVSATQKLLHPQPVEATNLAIAVMIVSIALTFMLVTFQRYVVKHSGSTAIAADNLHYVSDLLMNSAVILALLLSAHLGWHWADPVFALIIAAILLRGAWQVGKMAFDKLMDKSFPEEELEHIKQTALTEPGVLGVHNIKTRYSGTRSFIQMHLELDGNQPLVDAHRIADRLEKKLEEHYTSSEVIIHQDPVIQQ